MTKSERRKILYKACNRLYLKINDYSCNAIGFGSIISEYALFYEQSGKVYWYDLHYFKFDCSRNRRILMILLFEHVGLEGIK